MTEHSQSRRETVMAKRALVPVDGSGVSESILPFLVELGNPKDLDIIVLQVNGVIPPMAIEGTCYFTPEDFEGRRAESERYLDVVATELRNAGFRTRTCARRGEPVAEILAAAADDRVDLIAMTTHGRSGPARVLWGSVAEGVLRRAPVPVFLLRRTEKEVSRRRRAAVAAG
jgi:nucleotide-binding universal stress UspA family protein